MYLNKQLKCENLTLKTQKKNKLIKRSLRRIMQINAKSKILINYIQAFSNLTFGIGVQSPAVSKVNFLCVNSALSILGAILNLYVIRVVQMCAIIFVDLQEPRSTLTLSTLIHSTSKTLATSIQFPYSLLKASQTNSIAKTCAFLENYFWIIRRYTMKQILSSFSCLLKITTIMGPKPQQATSPER